MRPLKILYVNAFYSPDIGGGAELTLQRLAEGMRVRGHEVAVFATGSNSRVDDINGVRVFRNPIDNIYWHLTRDLPGKLKRAIWHWKDRSSSKMARRFDQVVKDFAPDVVSFHNLSGITSSTWRIPRARSIPSIQVLHDLYLLCPASSMFKNSCACAERCGACTLYRLSFSKRSEDVDAVVGVSNFVLNRVAGYGYFKKSLARVISNAQYPKDKVALPAGKTRFGYIGSLVPAKGLEWLIKQFPTDAGELLIAGDGPVSYVAKLKLLAEGKRISFVGKTSQRDFFSEIHVGIVPSIWSDTLPNVAIEAGAWGRAAIVSDRGGLPEIVTHGLNGIICDPLQPNSLGDAISAMANDRDLVERLAANGPAAVARFLDVNRFLDEHEQLYRALTATNQ